MSQSEFQIIHTYFEQAGLSFGRPGVALGIGDDAALFQLPPDRLLALTMDVLVADVHFPADADARQVATRALAVNLSDLAAMGAEPLGFTLGLSIPSADEGWLAAFADGLIELAQAHQCPLVGGDLVRGPLNIAIQAHGSCPVDRVIRRDGAQAGDCIYVSGALGEGATALLALELPSHLGPQFRLQRAPDARETAQLLAAYYAPQPRVELARRCAHLVSAGINLSDVLLGDLAHILERSGVGAEVQVERLPRAETVLALLDDTQARRAAMEGGDDYELLLTVPQGRCDEFERTAAGLGIAVTAIGRIVEGNEARYLDAGGEPLADLHPAYLHFGGA